MDKFRGGVELPSTLELVRRVETMPIWKSLIGFELGPTKHLDWVACNDTHPEGHPQLRACPETKYILESRVES